MEEFSSLMRKRGLRITPQKRAIYAALLNRCDHPRVEDLYETLRNTFPSMSLATVYDNLRRFVALGIVRELYLQDGVARYDANMDHHHHVFDTATGLISDIVTNAEISLPVPKELQGKIKDIQITYIT